MVHTKTTCVRNRIRGRSQPERDKGRWRIYDVPACWTFKRNKVGNCDLHGASGTRWTKWRAWQL